MSRDAMIAERLAEVVSTESLTVTQGRISELFSRVVAWATAAARPFPWRMTRDPYAILVAEILLRRTPAPRVQVVYQRLMETYPTVHHLAVAQASEVLALTQSLGLLARAKHLVKMARKVVDDFGGEVPKDSRGLLSLPGVGEYVASAVMCFAFGYPVMLVDGVTGRVWGRVLGTAAVRRRMLESAFLAPSESGESRLFNYGMLDIGGLFCKPRRPKCGTCPVADLCRFAQGRGPTS